MNWQDVRAILLAIVIGAAAAVVLVVGVAKFVTL